MIKKNASFRAVVLNRWAMASRVAQLRILIHKWAIPHKSGGPRTSGYFENGSHIQKGREMLVRMDSQQRDLVTAT